MKNYRKLAILAIFLFIFNFLFSSGSSLNSSATSKITALVAEAPPEIRVVDPQIRRVFMVGHPKDYKNELILEITSFECSDDGKTDLFVRYPTYLRVYDTNNSTYIEITLNGIQGAYNHSESGGENTEELRLVGSAVKESFILPYSVYYDGTAQVGTYTGSFRISVAYE